jgi:hypothetical protein
MGGNALKELGARRVESHRARALGAMVCQALDKVIQENGFDLPSHLIAAYRSKVDYGDLDILVPEEFVDLVGREELVQRLGLELGLGADMPFAQQFAKAPVFHTGLMLPEGGCLQVDLMPIRSLCYEFSKNYYAWNDLSKTFTIIAREMNGLRFGFDGLARSIKVDGKVLGDVVFTRDFDEALAFLDFDVARYRQGFDSLDEMFEYAASNPRFSKAPFQLENRNSRGRSQDSVRVTYMAFLDWMKDRDLREYDWATDTTDWMEKALTHFPQARIEYQRLIDLHELALANKQRYNGSVVTQITGFRHQSLGLFMEAFKKHQGEKTFDQWISETSDEGIKCAMLDFKTVWAPTDSLEP